MDNILPRSNKLFSTGRFLQLSLKTNAVKTVEVEFRIDRIQIKCVSKICSSLLIFFFNLVMKRKRFSRFEYSNSQPKYSTSVHFPSGFQFHASASSDRWVNNLTSNSQCTLLFQSRSTRQHSRGPRPTLDNNCLHV